MLQRLVGCFGVFDTVCHSLSKYCCISSGEQHIMVSPFADSWRALFIFLRSDGVIVCSDVVGLHRCSSGQQCLDKVLYYAVLTVVL